MTTINDIAQEANVSKSTVSKVINDYPGVKKETREKVIEIMQKNNYWPNSVARSLSNNKSKLIGMFVPSHLNNFFFRVVIRGLEEVFGKKGYDLVYFTNESWDEKALDFSYVEKCQDRNVDGAMLMGFGDVDETQFNRLVDSDLPSVFIDRDLIGKNTSYVVSDNVGGAENAVEYLYNLGHRKIGMILGPSGLKPSHDRFLGFQQILKKFNLRYESDWIFNDNYDHPQKSGYRYMQEYLKLKDRPTAIFAEDMFAIGAMRCLHDEGYQVPADFSIIGFDNIDLSEHYQLTTINQQKYKMGKKAAQLLLSIIEGENFSPVILPTNLIERQSCKEI